MCCSLYDICSSSPPSCYLSLPLLLVSLLSQIALAITSLFLFLPGATLSLYTILWTSHVGSFFIVPPQIHMETLDLILLRYGSFASAGFCHPPYHSWLQILESACLFSHFSHTYSNHLFLLLRIFLVSGSWSLLWRAGHWPYRKAMSPVGSLESAVWFSAMAQSISLLRHEPPTPLLESWWVYICEPFSKPLPPPLCSTSKGCLLSCLLYPWALSFRIRFTHSSSAFSNVFPLQTQGFH